MITWILLSTIFLAIFLLIRVIFIKTINIHIMFLLWILVAVRLLVPTYIPIQSDFINQYSISAIADNVLTLDESIPYMIDTYSLFGKDSSFNDSISASEYANSLEDVELHREISSTNDHKKETHPKPIFDNLFPSENENEFLGYIFEHPWLFIWLLGVVIVAMAMVISNIRWYHHLRRYRTPLETITEKFDSPLPVYYQLYKDRIYMICVLLSLLRWMIFC